MAGGDRTEQPTPKRLRDARKKGDVAKSPAVPAVAAAACVLVLAFSRWPEFTAAFKAGIAAAMTGQGGTDTLAQAASIITPMCRDLALVAVAPALAAGAALLAQTGFVFAPERLKLEPGRFNPGEALKRTFGGEALMRTAIALCGNLLLSGTALWIAARVAASAAALYRSRAPVLPAIAGLLAPAAWKVAGVAALFAAADWAFHRWRHRKRLMMTKQEVKDEYRESEGDPHVKAQRRRLHRQLAMASLKKSVRTARVVLVNPTHLAVALRYDDGDGAPVVAYKGGGAVAARMRAEAEDAGVPIVRDIPLARAIYSQVEVDEELPPAFYEAVAAIFNAAVRAAADVTTVE